MQVGDIGLPTREKIIEADDLVAVLQETIAKVRAQKAGSAGNKYAHGRC
jgi:hypothetical protein